MTLDTRLRFTLTLAMLKIVFSLISFLLCLLTPLSSVNLSSIINVGIIFLLVENTSISSMSFWNLNWGYYNLVSLFSVLDLWKCFQLLWPERFSIQLFLFKQIISRCYIIISAVSKEKTKQNKTKNPTTNTWPE